jgi:hypothetical protein
MGEPAPPRVHAGGWLAAYCSESAGSNVRQTELMQ